MVTRLALKSWLGKSRRDWDQKCQALMWQICNEFGHARTVYGSAKMAYSDSHIVGHNMDNAPAGAFGYWAIGRYWHVALSLGDGRWLMGSSHVDTKWGTNVGTTTSADYVRATGARPMGWAYTNGANSVAISEPLAPAATHERGLATVRQIAHYLNALKLGPATAASKDGKRGFRYWRLVQYWGRKNGWLPRAYFPTGIVGPRTRAIEAHLARVVAR